MHLENASPLAFTSAGVVADWGIVEPLPAATVDAGVLARPIVVAVGLPELPPHPATRTRLRNNPAASKLDQDRR
jgi:hypothetical protein